MRENAGYRRNKRSFERYSSNTEEPLNEAFETQIEYCDRFVRRLIRRAHPFAILVKDSKAKRSANARRQRTRAASCTNRGQ